MVRDECEKQVKGFAGAKFKKFGSKPDAEAFGIIQRGTHVITFIEKQGVSIFI